MRKKCVRKSSAHKERKMTIGEAQAFLIDVMTIVEKEMPPYMETQVWQRRQGGVKWSEGFLVDYSSWSDYDLAPLSDTYGIHYYVQCHDDDIALLRYDRKENGHITADMPFHGSVREAADYMMQEWKKYKQECSEDAV